MVSRMRFRRFYFSSVIEAWGGNGEALISMLGYG